MKNTQFSQSQLVNSQVMEIVSAYSIEDYSCNINHLHAFLYRGQMFWHILLPSGDQGHK
jgi:hypothetical protein